MKYTIVYPKTGMVGSHRWSVTKFDRVETDDLGTLLRDSYNSDVWFVFEGWPRLEGEETHPLAPSNR